MRNREDENEVWLALIDDRVRKAPNEYATARLANKCANLRVLANERYHQLDCVNERLAESMDSRLEKSRCLGELRLGLGMKRVRDHPSSRRSPANTASPGTG
jgi:hypothetical protein